MTRPGYIMADCGGLDLNDSTEQEITGHVLRIVIAADDGVTVTNLVAT